MWVWATAQMGRYFRVSGRERQTMEDNICAIGIIRRERPSVMPFKKTISKSFDIE
jgi:hypothetical protein